MNINQLSASLPKDKSGMISHRLISFGGQSSSETASDSPLPWEAYTSAEAATLCGVPKSQIWSLLHRGGVAATTKARANYWKKEDVHELARSLKKAEADIPKGYISLSTALKMSCTSRTSLSRALLRLGIPSEVIKVSGGKGIRRVKIIERKAFMNNIHKIQAEYQKDLLSGSY